MIKLAAEVKKLKAQGSKAPVVEEKPVEEEPPKKSAFDEEPAQEEQKKPVENFGPSNIISQLQDRRLREVVINFKPDHPVVNKVMVMGQFNSWLPEIMETYSEEECQVDPTLSKTYFYKTKVLVGYKYRYYFQVNNDDDFAVDETKENEISKKFKKRTNVIEVPKDDELDEIDMTDNTALKRVLSYNRDIAANLDQDV